MKINGLKISIITAAAVLFCNQCSIAETAVSLEKPDKRKIQISEPVKEISNSLYDSKDDMLKCYLQTQKKMDVEDIKILWESTVKRNSVIGFAIQKLSLPPDKRKLTSSRMTKTISTLIRGAAMLPGLFGTDPVISSVSSVSGGLAGRYISSKSLPKEMPMTDTELIQLARLVDELQDKVIKNYYEYKGNLEGFQVARQNSMKFSDQYSKSLDSKNIAEIISSQMLYNRAVREESQVKQKIKLNRLELERLAGVEPVDKLNLGKAQLLEEIKPDSHSDIDTNALAEEIKLELEDEKQELQADLQILWQAAVENSETLRFAMVKLSNPEGEVAKKSAIKRILSPIASVAPIVGLGLSDPVTAGSAMFSGNLLNSVLSDDSQFKQHLTKVTDADLVLLAQETDSLQEKLITLYHDYVSALIDLNYIDKMEQDSKYYFEQVQHTKPELNCVADAFKSQISDVKYKARQTVLSKRIALEQFVGNDALLAVEKSIKERLCSQD